jgi:glycosyltransferase 2 family protein
VKKLLITLLKIALSVAIIGYLVWNSTRSEDNANAFANLRDNFGSIGWGSLAAAWAFCAIAVLITFVRWWCLVRALDVPCRLPAAIRISFWGYLFNLAPLGIVGGDLVKAVMLGHEHPQHRAKALASVLMDRVIGLYVLFIVASVAILVTGFHRIDLGKYWWICPATFAATIIGTVGLFLVLGPDVSEGRIIRSFGRIPRVGRSLESLINAVRMYSRKPLVLVISSIMSVGVHGAFAVGCYFIACGLPGNHLSLADHFVIMPLSAATQVFPLPVGPFEFVLNFLYKHVAVIRGLALAEGQGFVVALVYRLITVLIAALGVSYYFRNRREMAEVIHEAERDANAGGAMP